MSIHQRSDVEVQLPVWQTGKKSPTRRKWNTRRLILLPLYLETMRITFVLGGISIMMIIMIPHMFVFMNLVHGQQHNEACPPRNHGDAIKFVERAPVLVFALIESCMGWQLSKLPALKEFLLGGDAETYQHVQVKFTIGRKPTMTVYHNGQVHETIQLEFFHSKTTLHKLFSKRKDSYFSLAINQNKGARLHVAISSNMHRNNSRHSMQ